MTSISSINSLSSLIPSSVGSTLPDTLPTASMNTSTAAAPGSGIMEYVNMFANNNDTSGGASTGNVSTSDLFLGMLTLPVIPLDYGNDDDDD